MPDFVLAQHLPDQHRHSTEPDEREDEDHEVHVVRELDGDQLTFPQSRGGQARRTGRNCRAEPGPAQPTAYEVQVTL
nr:hypothetical protein [Streptomyces halobius]